MNMMKLSDNTFDVLKNFSTINPSISVKAGNVLRTVSEQKNILAQAVVDESLPQPFAIYDLSQFLGLVSLFEDEEYDFGPSSVTISEGKNKSRYTYTDPSMVTAPPEKNLELPSVEVTFDLSYDSLKKVVNAANQLGLPEVVVKGEDGVVTLVATDTKNPTSNEFTFDLETTADAEFQFVFKVENFKFMADDYKVTISEKGISHFKGSKVEYWVATEAGSKYNG
jgi:hypothetical protein